MMDFNVFFFNILLTFSQHHARRDGRTLRSNLGVLLIEFFELYGRNFNYTNTGIGVKDGGTYFSKQEVNVNHSYSFNPFSVKFPQILFSPIILFPR